MNSKKAINFILRITTLGVRFLFVFILAKYLEPSDVGYYGIFAVTIGYAIFFLGLDFYTYVSREIIQIPKNRQGRLLKGQAAVSGIVYALFIPVFILALQNYSWPRGLFLWFLPIMILEHINQEISRLLIAMSEQLTSSFIIFIRQASWNILAIILMTLYSDWRDIVLIIPLWAAAGVAALGMGLWKLKQLGIKGWSIPIDWNWVKKGISVSSAFLMASLALRGIQTVDRYWFEKLVGIEMVGSYVLMQGIASVLIVFLESTLFAFVYPLLIKLNVEEKHKEAHRHVRVMFFNTLVVSLIFGVISWILLPYFLNWINKPIYQQAIGLYPWIISSVILNALSMSPHFGLYARGKDSPIIKSNIAAFMLFMLVSFALSDLNKMLAIPIAMNAAFFCILSWQSIAYLSLIRKNEKVSFSKFKNI